MNITLKGRIPSKKNSKRIIGRGRPMLISSKAYQEWEAGQLIYLRSLNLSKGIEKASIKVVFYMPDNRKADLSNKFESIADLLVKAGILVDDSWQCLSPVLLVCEGVDKENPRVELELTLVGG